MARCVLPSTCEQTNKRAKVLPMALFVSSQDLSGPKMQFTRLHALLAGFFRAEKLSQGFVRLHAVLRSCGKEDVRSRTSEKGKLSEDASQKLA